ATPQRRGRRGGRPSSMQCRIEGSFLDIDTTAFQSLAVLETLVHFDLQVPLAYVLPSGWETDGSRSNAQWHWRNQAPWLPMKQRRKSTGPNRSCDLRLTS